MAAWPDAESAMQNEIREKTGRPIQEIICGESGKIAEKELDIQKKRMWNMSWEKRRKRRTKKSNSGRFPKDYKKQRFFIALLIAALEHRMK